MYWLNTWAKALGLDVKFEVINAGRSGVVSPNIEEIFRLEVEPLEPDIVVYHEGSNQFFPPGMIKILEGERVKAILNQMPADPGAATKMALSGLSG